MRCATVPVLLLPLPTRPTPGTAASTRLARVGAEPGWRELAHDLVAPAYRPAMSMLCGRDLTSAPLEVNVFHYGPGNLLGPHPDLPDKVVTHVLYFNRTWNVADGGCLRVLRSRDVADVAAEVLPIVGNSAVLVRSDPSWHAVSRVVHGSKCRRSVTATLYRPGLRAPCGRWATRHRSTLRCARSRCPGRSSGECMGTAASPRIAELTYRGDGEIRRLTQGVQSVSERDRSGNALVLGVESRGYGKDGRSLPRRS
jgi:2OG-Fe(II) oxygenase superfamily